MFLKLMQLSLNIVPPAIWKALPTYHVTYIGWSLGPWEQSFSAPEGFIFGEIMTGKISFLVLFLQIYKLRTWKVLQKSSLLISKELAFHLCGDLLWAGPWDPSGHRTETCKDDGENSKQLVAAAWLESHHALIIIICSLIMYLHSGRLNIQLLLRL